MMTNQNDVRTRSKASSRRFILAGAFCLFGIPLQVSAQMKSSEPMPMNKTALQGSTAKNGSKSMELTMSMENMHKKMADMQMTGHTDLDFAMTMR